MISARGKLNLTTEQRLERLEGALFGPSPFENPLRVETVTIHQAQITQAIVSKAEIEEVIAGYYAAGGIIGDWYIGRPELRNTLPGNQRAGLRPGSWPFYSGAEEPSAAPFRVNTQGQLWATQAVIAGTITASGGEIAGWEIGPTALEKNDAILSSAGFLRLGTGDNVIEVNAQDTSFRLWAGNASPTSAPFSVGKTGFVKAANANITGYINAQTGLLGSLTVVGQLKVGQLANNILIDGSAIPSRIASSQYGSGFAGFNITADGEAEFNNVTVRGRISAATFVKDLISAHAGTLLIVKSAGRLLLPHNTNDLLTVETPPSGGWLFDNQDIVRLRQIMAETVLDVWEQVSPVADSLNVYTTTKLSGPTTGFYAGEVVTDYGQAGDGGILLTADQVASPRMSVFTHSGAPWSVTSEQVRIGNLKDWATPLDTDRYGWAVGNYNEGTYAFYNPVDGMEIGGLIRLRAGESEGEYPWLKWYYHDPYWHIDRLVGQAEAGVTLLRWGDGAAGPGVLIHGQVQSWPYAEFMSGGVGIRGTNVSQAGFQLIVSGEDVSIYRRESTTEDWTRLVRLAVYEPWTGNRYTDFGLDTYFSKSAFFDTDAHFGGETYFTKGLAIGYPGGTTAAAGQIWLYKDSTAVGELSVQDTSWLRINQDIAKPVYTPRLFYTNGGLCSGYVPSLTGGQLGTTGHIKCGGGIYVGSSTLSPSTGNIYATGSIKKSTAIGCFVTRNSAQTIPSGSLQVISFNVENVDTDNCWSSSQPTRLIAQTAGYYMAGGSVKLNTGTTSVFRLQVGVRKNGTIYLSRQDFLTGVNALLGPETTTGMFYMDVDDYIEIFTYQDSGSNKTTGGSSNPFEVNGWLARIA